MLNWVPGMARVSQVEALFFCRAATQVCLNLNLVGRATPPHRAHGSLTTTDRDFSIAEGNSIPTKRGYRPELHPDAPERKADDGVLAIVRIYAAPEYGC